MFEFQNRCLTSSAAPSDIAAAPSDVAAAPSNVGAAAPSGSGANAGRFQAIVRIIVYQCT